MFNPTCEYAVANGNESWQPNMLLQKMESDLAILPLFFTQPNDYVLVDSYPTGGYISELLELELQLPEFILKNKAFLQTKFINTPKGKLLPWGWSPAAHKLLKPLKKSCSIDFLTSPVSTWKPEYRDLYSKKFAREILIEISNHIESQIIIPTELQSSICTSPTEIEKLLKQWGKLMIKAPWSSSGRGLQPITKTPVHPKVWEKLKGIINEQGYLIVEPFLNKVMDLALQFELKNKKVTYIGVSRFITDKKGKYMGNCLNGYADSTAPEVRYFADSIPEKILAPLITVIESSKLALWYEGFFGVDTLIFQDKNKQLRINPCLEINVRQTMGTLSLQLEKLVHPDKKAIFRTFYQPGNTYFSFKNEMKKKHLLKLTGNQIKSGFVSLTDAVPDTLFGAYILV
jgi:hypothetical protein